MKSPAFQMYAADIYMDTNEWSAEAFGIYNRLLNHQWVNGSIPPDLKTLAQISFVGIKTMSKRWPEMVAKFEFDDTNRGKNKRLEETREKQLQYIEKQREKGKVRANKMWEGHIAAATSSAIDRLQPEVLPKHSSSSSTSSSKDITPISPKNQLPKSKKEVKKKPTPIPAGFSISDHVREWAVKKNMNRLDEHLENFISSCQAKGYEYLDWDAAFMNAIRQNWAKVGGNGNGSTAYRTDIRGQKVPDEQANEIQRLNSEWAALKKASRDTPRGNAKIDHVTDLKSNNDG
jgi:uncharacterized protein YdaU (DUF1376 family)